jgi:hypothetical protein
MVAYYIEIIRSLLASTRARLAILMVDGDFEAGPVSSRVSL